MTTATEQYKNLKQQMEAERLQEKKENEMRQGGGEWDSVVHGINCIKKKRCVAKCRKAFGSKEWFPVNEVAKFKCKESGDTTLKIHDIKPADLTPKDNSIEKLTTAIESLAKKGEK